MNRECNVTKRVRTSQGPRYCPVVLSANGRIKPDAVLVNGKPEHHPEGSYYHRMARWVTNGSGYPLARMPPTPARGDFERKPN